MAVYGYCSGCSKEARWAYQWDYKKHGWRLTTTGYWCPRCITQQAGPPEMKREE